MTDTDDAPQAIPAGWRERRSAAAWCEAFGLTVQNPPRGWRGRWELPWESPLSLREFYERMCRSQLGGTARLSGWITLMSLAQALEDEEAGTSGTGPDLGASLRTHEPINRSPLTVQIALPHGSLDPGFYVTVPSLPARGDDFQVSLTHDGRRASRAYRVESVVWFIDRDDPDNRQANGVRVNVW